MSRTPKVALFAGVLTLITLIGGANLIVRQTVVSPDAIRGSVTRSASDLDRAWNLPVASTFKKEVSWQSNPSTEELSAEQRYLRRHRPNVEMPADPQILD